jgi:hypothetical protein
LFPMIPMANSINKIKLVISIKQAPSSNACRVYFANIMLHFMPQ